MLSVEDFLRKQALGAPVLDVRSPAEFEHGHLLGAVSMPLFSNEERAEVGTIYKQKGPEAAFKKGLDFVGPKMSAFVERAEKLARRDGKKQVLVHCWRGGQRSKSVAWLLRSAGFEAEILEGGYKNYRHFVLDFFEKTRLPLVVIGGKTGVGKTKILRKLAEMGEKCIDLEALANHKGSAFGSLGEPEQPSVEQFETLLFSKMRGLENAPRVWVENESRSIGRCFLPPTFWAQKSAAPVVVVEISEQARLENLLEDYSKMPIDGLATAFRNIEKKLGPQHCRAALEALEAGDLAQAAQIALVYYDKTYAHGLDSSGGEKRVFSFEKMDAGEIASTLAAARF